MPKMKTRRAAAKRFTETGSGQFKRNKAKRSPRRERETSEKQHWFPSLITNV